jgi:outer membrane lipoprotein SlyB
MNINVKRTAGCATALSLALVLSTAYAANDATTTSTDNSTTTTQAPAPMTGKDKATAIGAGSGAVAGAVVGGPVGAVVGAGIGAVVGHEGTDANGHVTTSRMPDSKVRSAQTALNDRGYSVGVDGRWGPNTESAVRSFQAKNGLTENGKLDSATLNALGVS